jgi:uncharacterized protein (TIGR02217 family)
MTGFHEVRFPLRLALATSGGPVRRTDIVRLSNGLESRNARWSEARRSYDAGSSVKGIDDLYEIVRFFEARMGQLYGFRFRDPLDHKSCGPGEAVTAFDQVLGEGDGVRTEFQLVKSYADAGGGVVRPIAKPVEGSVVVAVDGVTVADAAVDAAGGTVTFQAAPAAGATVSAGFEFDVPVRFDIDRLEINLTAFRAGQVPSVPLTEIRP